MPPGLDRPRPPWRALTWLVVGAAALRVVNLDTWSLWLDEGATWSWATRATWGGTIFAEANHPPLWWIVERLAVAWLGDSAAALRAPAVLLGIVAVPMAWWLGVRLLDPYAVPRRGGFARKPDDGRGRRAALVFAALVAGSPYLIEYTQEARMYPLLLVETLGLCLLYLRWLDRGDRLSLVGYALVATAALHTHYFGVWVPVAHAAHALWASRGDEARAQGLRPWPFLAAVAVAGLLFVPWFLHFATHYQGIAKQPREPFSTLGYVLWRMGIGPAIVVMDRARMAQTLPEVLAGSLGPVLLSALLFLGPVGLGVARLRHRPGLGRFVLANVGVPLLVLLAITPWLPLIHERYLMFLVPWPFLLAAMAAEARPPAVAWAVRGALVVLVGMGVLAYHGPDRTLQPDGRAGRLDGRPVPAAWRPQDETFGWLHRGVPYGREPWREVHAFVAAHAEPGDLVCLHPHYMHLAWDANATEATRDLEQLRLSMEPWDATRVREEHADVLRPRRRVFLVLSHETTPDPDHWFRVLFPVLGSLWSEAGAGGISAVPPVLFDLSWGVRVAVFTRE